MPKAARRGVTIAVAFVLITCLAVVGVFAWRSGLDPLADTDVCTADVGDDNEIEIDVEQAENVSLMAAIAERRGMPARAVSIAIQTAFQESKLRNIDYGDRDSVGLFQQRPSQGWGKSRQIRQPSYAINAFYDALENVDGYRSMKLHDAAQAVQRSADGSAYEQHEIGARALASALSGHEPGAFSCTVDEPEDSGQSERANGLTRDADTLRRDVEKAFGPQQTGGYAPGGVEDGHSEGSAHYDGRAIDFTFTPVNARSKLTGWTLAHYLVANATRLGVRTVIYDDKIWTAARSSAAWRDYDAPDGANQRTLRHLDHVHVDVA